MDLGAAPSHSDLLEEVLERIGDQSQPLAVFARAYLERIPWDVAMSPDPAYQEVVGLFDFIEQRSGPIAVRVFNPTMDEHGYESSGTVVEINVDDAPFLVDSITAELQARDLAVLRVLHPVVGVTRDESGRLSAVLPARQAQARESVQHYVLDSILDPADHPELQRGLEAVLADVLSAVRDFSEMVDSTGRMAELVRDGGDHYSDIEVDEATAFLEWLRDDNFVFLGYREYRVTDTPAGPALEVVPESGLGILADAGQSKSAEPLPLASMPDELRARYEQGDLLVISKTNRLSTVHRRARMDYVGARVLSSEGETVGEARLLGLFTSKAYMESVSRIPILRQKMEDVASGEDLIEGSHDHKAMVALIESFPKDELFGLPTTDLRRVLMGLIALQERAQVRLFVRRDLLDRGVRILVAMPRDRYSSDLRDRLQDLFLDRFDGTTVDYHLTLGRSDIARLHFIVWVPEGQEPDVAFEELETEVMALTRSWSEQVAEELADRHGPDQAEEMVASWAPRLPDYYASSTPLHLVAGDIERLDELMQGGSRSLVGLQNEADGPDALTRVALYERDGKRALSELTPALEHMGMKVIEEVPTRLTGEGEVFIHDFGVVGADGAQIDLDASGERIAAALEAVWEGTAESDSLNRLVLVAGLDYHQVDILRAYGTYWRRVSSTFTIKYVNDALVAHPQITADLVRLFQLRFDPASDGVGYEDAREEMLGRLEEIPSIDEDRILRGFFRLIEATVRTNAYVSGRRSLSLKLRSADVPDMPAPRPHLEVFVIGDEVEGIHLRAGQKARGGIRWSERREDYRTEVLGLMKAQVTKNAIIVPTGAKGGFVLRRPPADPEDRVEAVRSAYEDFVGGLLDVTDNLVDGEVDHPGNVRVHDDADPYLVVAADRGTARFSDIANQLAGERDFWLDDAFASGGATGYDHKALGITARGAWKSLESHFLEDGIDAREQPLTFVGIGDMSGDVFGNGMLVSESIRLLAAFDHRHIFLDPDPDPRLSFQERKRLFELSHSSWGDYDLTLISEGGGVYSRTAKKVDLSSQARAMLGTDAEVVTTAELIRIILRAPVDVVWNGGVGTYVKATDETHEEVGDRTNDGVRVDGAQLRARVVVEGGNLGVTQRGRIEYARAGGKINTDFIDNSGGVHCSDREVNLKILLRLAEQRGEIARQQRDELLQREAGNVVEAILRQSLGQAQLLAREEAASVDRMDAYERLMVSLEEEGALDRELEFLPSSQEKTERARAGKGLTRPELAVLLAYAKRSVADAVLASDLPDSDSMLADLTGYFPGETPQRFGHLVWDHPLRRELIATIAANDIVDSQGPTFVSRLVARRGAGVAEVVAAYRSARDLVGGIERRRAVQGLLGSVDYEIWTETIDANDRLVATLTRWYLRKGPGTVAEEDAMSSEEFLQLEDEANEWGGRQWRLEKTRRIDRLVAAGIPAVVARRTVTAPDLVQAPDIIGVARVTGRSRIEVGRLFHQIGKVLGLDKLAKVLAKLKLTDRWHQWALENIEDDLLAARSSLARQVLAEEPVAPVDEAVEKFTSRRAGSVARVLELVRDLESGMVDDPSPLLVMMRQIQALAGEETG